MKEQIRLTRVKGVSKTYSRMKCCSIFKVQEILKEVSVTNAEGPPVPIPNTEVKLCSGEDTLREAARENSSMLTQEKGTDKTVPES